MLRIVRPSTASSTSRTAPVMAVSRSLPSAPPVASAFLRCLAGEGLVRLVATGPLVIRRSSLRWSSRGEQYPARGAVAANDQAQPHLLGRTARLADRSSHIGPAERGYRTGPDRDSADGDDPH